MARETEVYKTGWSAYYSGYSLDDNPYAKWTDQYDQWKEGWESAKHHEDNWNKRLNKTLFS